MKLGIFDYLDNATKSLDDNAPIFHRASEKISAAFETLFAEEDCVVGVTYRIKTADSFREKIVRNNLYKECSAEEMPFEMHDVVGVKLECRFLADEATVYNALVNAFTGKAEDGTSCLEGKKSLRLDLSGEQPQRQKNGLNIYRIDGYLLTSGRKVRFELQIKSLVNTFWSEIEHKIIYKNKRKISLDDFLSRMMFSLNDTLVTIDSQLNSIYCHTLDNSLQTQRKNIEASMASLITEMFGHITEIKTGVPLAIKDFSESIVKYMLYYSSFAKNARESILEVISGIAVDSDEARVEEIGRRLMSGALKGSDDYGGLVVELMNAFKKVDYENLPIGEEIELPSYEYSDDLERIIGEKIQASINTDIKVNTFFHVFCSLETGTYAEDVKSYITYYAQRVSKDKTPDEIEKLKYLISVTKPDKLLLEPELERIAALQE